MKLRSAIWSMAVTALVLGAACTNASLPPAAHGASRRAPPLHRGPLTDFVAAAGLRWMVVGNPKRIADNPVLSRELAPLIPSAGLDAFQASSGLDLRKTSSALVAGFDYGLLYAATCSDNHSIEQHFVDRLVSGALRRRPHPALTMISGIVGTKPETMVSIDHQLVAVAVGDPTPGRVVAAFARGQLKRSPSALRGAALSTLPSDLEHAPVRFYAPGPLPPSWVGGAHGLLGQAEAVGIGALPAPNDALKVRVVLSGGFAQNAALSEERLLATWKDLSQSDLGDLLGFNHPLVPPRVSVSPGWIELKVSLSRSTLFDGLRAAVSDDVRQMLRMPRQPPPQSR